jgi:hypothetical protein
MIAAREQAVRLAEELQPTLVMLNDTETVILYMQVSPPTVDIHDSNEPCTPEVCDACKFRLRDYVKILYWHKMPFLGEAAQLCLTE